MTMVNVRLSEHSTGKERDAETGLDFFLARYYSGAQGRFTGPDEPLMDQDAADPQSWNLYSYVRNNPLRAIDPTGRKCITLDNGTKADDGAGGGCAEAGVDARGNIRPLEIKVTTREPLLTLDDVNPFRDGPPLAFEGFGNLFLNGRVVQGGAQMAVGILPSALLSFAAARFAGEPLFQGFEAARNTAFTAKGLSASTAFNAGKGLLNGETKGFTDHAISQAVARGVTKGEIAEALTHVAKGTGGSVLRFIGQGAEVRVNQITGKIVTVIRFSAPGAK
jgi:RHS repeat-associated protein